MSNLQNIIERIVEEKVKRQRDFVNTPHHRQADIAQHGQQVYDTTKNKEKQAGRELSRALSRVHSSGRDRKRGGDNPFYHPDDGPHGSHSTNTARDTEKGGKVSFPDLRHPSGEHGKKMSPFRYAGEESGDQYPDNSGRSNLGAAHDQIASDAETEGHRKGSSAKFQGERTRSSRWDKIEKRSTIGAKVKRGLGKLLGIGRYSKKGKKKANLGEAYRELARDYILEALRFPKPSTDGKSKIPVLKGKAAEGPWKPHPKTKQYDPKRRTKLATTKWDVPPTKDK